MHISAHDSTGKRPAVLLGEFQRPQSLRHAYSVGSPEARSDGNDLDSVREVKKVVHGNVTHPEDRNQVEGDVVLAKIGKVGTH